MTALAMAACAQKEPAAAPQLGMANPASTYCVKIGGMLRIEKTARGDALGICVLPNGTEMEEWTLFRRDHPKGEMK